MVMHELFCTQNSYFGMVCAKTEDEHLDWVRNETNNAVVVGRNVYESTAGKIKADVDSSNNNLGEAGGKRRCQEVWGTEKHHVSLPLKKSSR